MNEEEGILKNPTLKMMNSQEFNAVWNIIKSWEIKINKEIEPANGSHVRLILDSIRKSRPNTVIEIIKKLKNKSLNDKTKDVLINKLLKMLNNTII